MTFQSHCFTDRTLLHPAAPDPRRPVPAGILSRRELRRIIAEQLD